MKPGSKTLFGGVVLATLAVKLSLAASLPVLGDEAYFFTWGRIPALGYYDHPPLVGWIPVMEEATDDSRDLSTHPLGMVDVRSGSEEMSSEGTLYSQW